MMLSTVVTTAMLQQRLATFNQAWRQAALSDQVLPPAFVIDLLAALLREVVRPFTDLQLAMLRDLSNIFVAGEITAAAGKLDDYWNMRLQPVLLAAVRARDAGLASMAVQVPGARSTTQGLAWHVSALLVEVIAGYQRLAELEALKPWYLKLHGITDAMVRFLDQAGRMVQQAQRVIAAAGAIAYAPIAAIQSAISWTIKASLVGVAAYLLWKTRRAS